MILQGDETSYVDATATANSTVVDPFTYVNKVIVGSGTSTVNVSLIGGNPDVVFTGSNPSLPSYHFMYGPHSDGEPHFGLEPLSNGVKCDYVSEDGTMFPSSRRFR